MITLEHVLPVETNNGFSWQYFQLDSLLAKAHARTHSLHVYVAQVRQKIEPLPELPQFILTIPGVGYRFNGLAES